MEQTTTGADGAPKRPTFLTVLCILSFVAAGISVIGGIMGYMAMAAVGGMSDAMGANMEAIAAMEGMESMPGMEDAMGLFAHAKTLLIVAIAITLVALAGVIMMWQLKKTGFYIYTGAQVLGIVIPVVIAGMAAMSWFGLVISVAFIVMYALNLKHMS